MLQFFKQGVTFSLDAFNRMLGSNMAADNRTTDPSGLCSNNLVTMAKRNLCTSFMNALRCNNIFLF